MLQKGNRCKKYTENKTNRDIFLVEKIGDEHSEFGYQTKDSQHTTYLVVGTCKLPTGTRALVSKTWKIIIEKNEDKSAYSRTAYNKLNGKNENESKQKKKQNLRTGYKWAQHFRKKKIGKDGEERRADGIRRWRDTGEHVACHSHKIIIHNTKTNI